MKLTVASTVGKNSTLTVSDEVFGAPMNPQLLAQAVRVYLANQRQGTSKTKTRSEINRTKKKWYKQKGTGNARHGARTPSLFVGGGVTHGPSGIQNYVLKLSSTMKQRALATALSAQVAQTIVLDDLAQLDGTTASAHKLLTKMLPNADHVLIVVNEALPMMMRSLRNLDYVFVTTASRLTTYEVAYADAIVFTSDAIKGIEARLTKKSMVKVAPEVVAEAPVKVKPEPKAKPAVKKPAAKAKKVAKK